MSPDTGPSSGEMGSLDLTTRSGARAPCLNVLRLTTLPVSACCTCTLIVVETMIACVLHCAGIPVSRSLDVKRAPEPGKLVVAVLKRRLPACRTCAGSCTNRSSSIASRCTQQIENVRIAASLPTYSYMLFWF